MRLSAIIPTWCEAGYIADAVTAARAVADEVLVVDGGSSDSTRREAEAAGARVIVAARGRGTQLNMGASAAGGDAFLFLHADARLPSEARRALDLALMDTRVVGGNFRIRFVPDTFWARTFSTANDMRRRFMRIYYGDSAVFVRRESYEALGGFPSVPLFEDYELVRGLERLGPTAYLRDVTVEVSARRFQDRPLRTLALWGSIQALYSLGVPAARLACLYE